MPCYVQINMSLLLCSYVTLNQTHKLWKIKTYKLENDSLNFDDDVLEGIFATLLPRFVIFQCVLKQNMLLKWIHIELAKIKL